MSQRASTRPTRTKEDALTDASDRMGRALSAPLSGREREWTEVVGAAVDAVEQALRLHKRSAEAPEGLFAEVDVSSSTKARQMDGLRRDHGELLAQCLDLEEHVQQAIRALSPMPGRAGGPPDFGTLRSQGEKLLAHLRQNMEGETNLILESITTDIGVGD